MPQERLQLAIDLLDRGESRRAGVELKAYVAELPDKSAPDNGSAAANSMVSANTTASANMTASSNAAALANRKPAPLAPPKPATAKPADPPSPPAQKTFESPADAWAAIREDVEAGLFDSAIKVAESNHFAPDRAQAPLLASAYAANAKAIRRSNAAQAGAQALLAGRLYLETADMPEVALESLQLAVAVSPNDARARTLLASAKSKTIEIYYRNGLIAFRRQDLDGALAAWDRILAIDPNHEKAQANKTQTLKLKNALQSLM
jgi:tetratricopeptide (TPR) repeat protein